MERSGPSGSATGTLGVEWQCGRCAWVRSGPSGSATGAPGYARSRVAVRRVRPGTLGAEWQCGSHCHLPVNVRRLNAQCRVAVRPVRSDPSGSATGAPGYARGRVAVRITLPSGIERTAAVRSGPSGSATGAPGYARGRVAVRITLPSGIERTATVRLGSSGSAMGTLGAEWQCGSHCHLPVNVRWWSVQCRVAVRPVRSGPSGSVDPGRLWTCGHCTDMGTAPPTGLRERRGHLLRTKTASWLIRLIVEAS